MLVKVYLKKANNKKWKPDSRPCQNPWGTVGDPQRSLFAQSRTASDIRSWI
jgi:hypothetical protein